MSGESRLTDDQRTYDTRINSILSPLFPFMSPFTSFFYRL